MHHLSFLQGIGFCIKTDLHYFTGVFFHLQREKEIMKILTDLGMRSCHMQRKLRREFSVQLCRIFKQLRRFASNHNPTSETKQKNKS